MRQKTTFRNPASVIYFAKYLCSAICFEWVGGQDKSLIQNYIWSIILDEVSACLSVFRVVI